MSSKVSVCSVSLSAVEPATVTCNGHQVALQRRRVPQLVVAARRDAGVTFIAVTVDMRDFRGSVYMLWLGDWAMGQLTMVAMLLGDNMGKPCVMEGTSSTVR